MREKGKKLRLERGNKGKTKVNEGKGGKKREETGEGRVKNGRRGDMVSEGKLGSLRGKIGLIRERGGG